MSDDAGSDSPRGPLAAGTLAVLALIALAAFVALIALGNWQVQRRTWKLDLIERVDQRVHAPATPAPGPRDWPLIGAARDEYRHVLVSGRFLHPHETLVQASTVHGAGFWVLTPLQLADGTRVLVNRGFVPPDRRAPESRGTPPGAPDDEVTVTGLLRLTEPGGGFLRKNAPSEGRWHSRDVAAIATAHRLDRTAPYFIDADAGPPGVWPIGGLTVTSFKNNHAGYAFTWYTLALMLVAGAWIFGRREWRLRQVRTA